MRLNRFFKYIPFAVSCAVFIYGFTLLMEASRPCGSDGCLIHLLYFIAIPMLLVSGIVSYKLGKKLFKKKSDQ